MFAEVMGLNPVEASRLFKVHVRKLFKIAQIKCGDNVFTLFMMIMMIEGEELFLTGLGARSEI